MKPSYKHLATAVAVIGVGATWYALAGWPDAPTPAAAPADSTRPAVAGPTAAGASDQQPNADLQAALAAMTRAVDALGADSAAQTEALSARLSAIDARLHAVEQRAADMPLDAAALESETPEEIDERKAERAEQADAWVHDQVALLEDSHVLQGEDPEFAQATRTRLDDAFAEHRKDYALDAVDCGAEMCRLSARRLNESPGLNVDHIVHGIAAWEGQSMMQLDEATGEVTVYLMRDGVQMPVAEMGDG